MSEREEKCGGLGCAIGLVLVVLLLPVLYVLGVGPAAFVASRYPATDPFLTMIYSPLTNLAVDFCTLRSVLEWYANLWM